MHFVCAACSFQVPEGSSFCPRCGAALEIASATPTRTSVPSDIPPPAAAPARHLTTDPSGGGRFLPGTVLAGRYRILGLLGRGGMGEVYRADDLKLGQAVALKFLPASVERDQARLQRFLNEVKIARQISHPGVCRAYDVGEVDGHHFISMEYVDGEDLASLLRRIGRLPRDKAVQIARQLCAGLAAAHDQGVLHRDLKPANVMIDGRGRAKIADFGLATLAEEIGAADVGAGTPAYMAPEQRDGKDVTVRSDLYALGLVLYELFTGRPAFKAATLAELARLQEESTPTSPSHLVDGLDPTIERAILRCLEKDPRRRPASALAVAASLPGADPLAAALAAGETPSPEMVAAAGEEGALRPAVACACLASVLVGLALVLWRLPREQLVDIVGMDKPPEVLAERARELTKKLGYPETPVHEAYGFFVYWEFVRHIAETDHTPNRWKALGGPGMTGVVFWYRASPRYMFPSALGWLNSTLSFSDPPVTQSGMVSFQLDPRGRLLSFRRVPPQRDPSEGPFPEPDWTVLLQEAGLDPAAVRNARPIWNPPMSTDARAAWDWTDPKRPAELVRLEAGAYHGNPVSFDWWLPWERPYLMEELRLTAAEKGTQYLVIAIGVVLLVGGGLLARRNLRLGRGDRRGALRSGAFLFAVSMASWIAGTNHVPQVWELVLIVGALGTALLFASAFALIYLALEPLARKMWPQILISWNRLLAGSFRDPLVSRDLLIGCLLGTWNRLLDPLGAEMNRLAGSPPPPPRSAMGGLLGVRDVLASTASSLSAAQMVFIILFLLVLLRMVLRKPWAAAAVVLAILTAIGLGDLYPSSVLGVVVGHAATIAVLVRFGLLAALAGDFVYELLESFAMPSNLSVWYAGPGLCALALVAAIALYGFRRSLGGRPAFGQGLIQE